jgi:hypothetical protein
MTENGAGGYLRAEAATVEPFPVFASRGTLVLESVMQRSSSANNRRGGRTKAVLPVRVKGIDCEGNAFDELAHTLDVTPEGTRLGSIRRQFNLFDEVTVFYRQRKMQFRVMWTRKLKDTKEFQVGLQAIGQDKEKDSWGLDFSEFKAQAMAFKAGHASRPA